ncbi:hypothetical protein CDES_14045 [Corynebacterium deserti GIMN1.010]|uniref:Uncharacterized protein n=1 Tax=Corynebacterium deserti GIMN1.010 TaxID=931089 RepID=A0A0M4CKL7_9CORY|nr:hypothetical protein [Corynebacterium deserti]ALC07134.1 hypothetical protein CDES_14045 [Corynebacterium deserti GIMN1.010]
MNWVDEPGWWTAEQAANAFNVTIREIKERYKQQLPAWAIREAVKEWRYEYDFEDPEYNWGDYAPQENRSTDLFKHRYDVWPESKKPPVDKENTDALRLVTHRDKGFDFGLEPKRRFRVVVIEELYDMEALMIVREERVLSRKVKPIPPRGLGGRFVKRSP